MFESVTKKRKNPLINIFGWTLLTVVCIVFVFVGFSPDSSFLGRGGAAAEVNGDAISLRDYKELLDRLESNQGGDREARRQAQQNAVNILVSRSLMVQEAEKLNIHVSDQEVARELMSIEPFFEDGRFSRLLYKTYLRQVRLTEAEFEDRIRRDRIIQKMSRLIGFSGNDLPMLDEFDKKIEQAQVNVAYAHISPQRFIPKTPSTVKLDEYIQANMDSIQDYYEKNQERFSRPEEIKARHILIKAEGEGESARAEALKKATEIRATLTPQNFAKVAQEHSDDPGSKNQGGNLGFFARGRMVPEFEEAAFNAQIGEISEPISSKFGYHLILVDEKKPALNKSLEDVKSQIAMELQGQERYQEVVEQFKKALADGNEAIEKLVREHDMQWKTTGFFSITRDNIPGIGQNPEFFDLALNLSPDNVYGSRLVFQDEEAYAIKFKGAQMSTPDKQNDQMDFFKQLMRQQKMNSLVQTWADSLREQASVKINPDLLQ